MGWAPRGSTVRRALITAIAALTMGAVTIAPSAIVPAGLVISQDPAGATNASGGTSVALVVSSGAPVTTAGEKKCP